MTRLADPPDAEKLTGLKQDMLRWLIGVVLAALTAYFTTISAIEGEVREVKTKQDSQFGEVLRRLELLQADIRELRGRP